MAKLTDTAQSQGHFPESLDCDITSISKGYVNTLLEGLCLAFDAVDDTLFDLANNARNNNEQNRYFEAMRELRLKRKSAEKSFATHILSCFEPSKALELESTPSSAAENLVLVDDSDLEERLALDTMATKANNLSQHIYLTLNSRIEALYESKISDFNSPTSTEQPTKALRQSCSNLDIESADLLLLYKHIDKHMMSLVPEALESIDLSLAKGGILPELTATSLRKAASAATSQSLQANTTKERALSHGSSNLKHKNSGETKPKSSLKNSNTSNGITYTEGSYTVASHQELRTALDLLGSEILNSVAANQTYSIKNIAADIQKTLRAEQSKVLSRNDLDLINLVALLFEYILDDENLVPEMQALISRLQIPVLKVVLKEPDFFNHHTHPARSLLDRLARAAIGWTSESNENSRSLHQEIQKIVGMITAHSDISSAMFNLADERLKVFLEREEKRRSLIEQRTRLTEEGRIKSRMAQQYVGTTLKHLMQGDDKLPSSIIDLFNGPWRRVLFLAFLRDEQEHNWGKMTRIAEELVWCATHQQSDADRQKWVAVVPRLLKQISVELDRISYEAYDAQLLTEAVRKSLATMFRESSLSNQVVQKPKFKKITNRETETDNSGAIHQQKASIDGSNTHPEINVGQWVELTEPNDKTHRLKLVTHIAEVDIYVFVDRLGLNPSEKSGQQLSSDYTSGRLKVLAKGSLVDRALSHVMGNLHR